MRQDTVLVSNTTDGGCPSNPSTRKSQLASALAYSLCGLAGTLWFFRFVVISGFDEIPGTIGDTRFLIYICEHWHKVFLGTASWLSPPFFYPIKGVLGYSDALFLYSLPFSFFRYLGLDLFTSFQLTVVLLPLVGYVGTVWLLRSTFQLSRGAAILGGMLFAFSSPLATSLAHAQLQSVVFVPYLVLLLCRWLRNLGESKGRLSGLAFSALFPLLAYTSFYIAWYFATFAFLVASLAVLWLVLTRQHETLSSWLRLASQNWLSIAGNVVVCLICSIPFLMTYLPVLKLFQGRPFQEVLPMLPMPVDLINVGFDNAVWGHALRWAVPGLQSRPLFWELDKGVSPIVLVVFLGSGLLAWSQYRASRRLASSSEREGSFTTRIVVLCSIAVCLVWLMMLRWGVVSPWWLVYKCIPGGSAVRSVYRFNIFLMLPVSLVVAYGTDQMTHVLGSSGISVRKLLLSLLVLAMLAEQCNTFHRDILRKQSERTILQQVPAPPANCTAMVIMAQTTPYPGWWAPVQISSTLISQRFNIPTLNGLSGWIPKGWSLDNPSDPTYGDRAVSWAKEHNVLDGLCAYQMETRTWEPLSDLSGASKGSPGRTAAPANARP